MRSGLPLLSRDGTASPPARCLCFIPTSAVLRASAQPPLRHADKQGSSPGWEYQLYLPYFCPLSTTHMKKQQRGVTSLTFVPEAGLESEKPGVPSALPRQPPFLTPPLQACRKLLSLVTHLWRSGLGLGLFFPVCLGNSLQTALSTGELVACERGFFTAGLTVILCPASFSVISFLAGSMSISECLPQPATLLLPNTTSVT